MKPILLKIKGLNSFEEEEVINFAKLIENGLFGIFGPTGSGKSTIIDAITISLYGEMARFKGERKTKNFINISCDSAYIYLKFALYRGEKYIEYVVERSYKKMKDTQKIVFARLYFYEENKVEIIADNATSVNNKIKEILGLSYEDFLKSVILPQGKFSDFLLLANKERRDMLERIFGLENYGEILVNKIKNILNEIKSNINILESKLNIYKDINEENIEEKIVKLKNIENNLEKALKEEESINLNLEKYINYKKLQEELLFYQKNLDTILKEENSISIEKNILNKIKKSNLAKPLYTELKDTEKNILYNEEKLNTIDNSYKKLKKEEEEFKIIYEKAKLEKENNYPILIKKEVEIKNIIDISKDAKKLEEEIKNLREKYKKFKIEYNIYEKEIENIKEEKENIEKNIVEIEKEKENLVVNVCYRDNVKKGFQIENNIKESKEELQNIENKINKTNKYIKLLNLEKLDILKKYDILDKTINKKEKDLSELLEIPIIDEENYSKEKEKIYNMGKVYERKKEIKEEIESLNLKYDESLKEYENIKNNYKEKENEILKLENSFNKLEEKFKTYEKNKIIDILVKNLEGKKPCPVCGSLDHPKKNSNFYIEEDSFIIEEENNYILKIEELKNEIKNLKISNTENKVQMSYKSKFIEEIKNNLFDLKDKIKNFKIKEEDIISTKEKLEKSLNLRKKTLKNIELLKAELDKLKNNKLSLKNENIVKDEIIKNNKEILENLNIDKNKLINKIEENDKILKKILLNINLNEVKFSILDKEIKSKDIKRENIEKKYCDFKKLLKEKECLLKELEEKYFILKNKIEELNIIGKEKKEILLKYNENIQKVCGENDLDSFLKEIENKIKYIEEEEKRISSIYKDINIEIESLLDKKKNIESQNILLKGIYNKKINEFTVYLEENNFLNEEEFTKYLNKNEKEKEKEIKDFEYKKLDLLNNINRIKEEIENTLKSEEIEIKEENLNKEIDDIRKRKENMKEKIISFREEKAIYKENIKKIKVEFKEVEKLKKEELLLKNKLDLLEDLYKLFECKKFVEYMAKKQLIYLVAEASKKLKDMTGGRYALELDDVEFVIRDDLNGGARRMPKTLSGGETFITSLCLALALSSKIQLKNKSPIELFFLDEGFGTLDRDLLDIVMENLMKLQRQKINIGVISHIEEVKTRIQRKLIIRDNQGIEKKKITIE